LGTTNVGLNVDPKLNNPGGGGTFNNTTLLDTLTAYNLQSTSPLINAGLDLSGLFGINNGGQDFYGTPLMPGVVDIGAHESASTSPPNMQLLSDPGFENNGAGWQRAFNGGRSIVGTQYYAGAKSLQMVVSNSYAREVYQDVAVTGGVSYDASAWVQTTGIGVAGARVVLLWLNTTAADPLPAGSIIRTDIVGTVGGSTNWTQLFGSYTAPLNAVMLRVQLYIGIEADNSGTAWFDEVRLIHH
jgi:hypothetical protein